MCGRSACTVRREGGSKPIDPPYPYRKISPAEPDRPGITQSHLVCPRCPHDTERCNTKTCALVRLSPVREYPYDPKMPGAAALCSTPNDSKASDRRSEQDERRGFGNGRKAMPAMN